MLSNFDRFLRRLTQRSKPSRDGRVKRLRGSLEQLECRQLLAADSIIVEFQAVNDTTLADVDGDFPDWLELRNNQTASLDLEGWYLTDDATDLTKWRFPEVTLGVGEQLIVFASGKNRVDPQAELHANFRLSAAGEYLALVQPDGLTVVQDFGDQYPPQLPDQSYGLATARVPTVFVDNSSPVRTLVPSSDGDMSWLAADFDDTAWDAATGAVGFEVLASGVTAETDFTQPLGPEWTVDVPEGAKANVTFGNSGMKIRVTAPGQDATYSDRGLAPIVLRDLPGENPLDWEIETHVISSRPVRGGAGIAIIDPATGTPAFTFEYINRRRYSFFVDGQQIETKPASNREDYYLRLVRDSLAGTWTGYYRAATQNNWVLSDTITDGVEGVPVIKRPQVGLYARTTTADAMDATFDSVKITVADQYPVYGPQIDVDVKESAYTVNASLYARLPFEVEGDPARMSSLELVTQVDDGYVAFLNGEQIASRNAPIDFGWNSPAAEEFGAVGLDIPRDVWDVSEHLGKLVPGKNVLGVQLMNVDAADKDLFFKAALIANELSSTEVRSFSVPTPGAPNFAPQAETPQLTAEEGVFFGSTVVELSLADPKPYLEIRYTLDGSEPTPESSLYTEPLTLTASAMLQAKTFDNLPVPNLRPSRAVAGTFVALAEEIRNHTSDIPIIILDTVQQRLASASTNDLTRMNVVVIDTSRDGGRASLEEPVIDYLGRGGARDRGSSTAGQPKPNMAFETWGPDGTNKDDDFDVPFLGMTPESDWVLHAPWNFDRALIRNQLAFDLSVQTGQWASDFRPAEVYLNRGDGVVSNNDYMGVYAVLEKIKQGPDRVDIASIDATAVKEPEISGGFMMKVDRSDPDGGTFPGGGQVMNWVYPKGPKSRIARDDQKVTLEQEAWLKDYFKAFASTLSDPDISDPEGYSKYIDVISWVDQHLLNVFMMNVDALRLSAYMHKDREGKIKYGPPWDFDRSAESTDSRDDNPNVWRSEAGDLGTDFFGNGTQRFWGNLFDDSGFWQLYIDRWYMWRQSVFSDENVRATIDRLGNEVHESAERNAARWGGSVVFRRSSGFDSGVLDGTHQGEVDHLWKWLTERAAFMDSNFAPVPIYEIGTEILSEAEGVRVDPGTEVKIDSPAVDLFVDTKLVDGEDENTIGSYLSPTDDSLGTTWTELEFDDSAWLSGPLGVGHDNDNFVPFIGTTLDPRDNPGATTILGRVRFEATNLADFADQSLVLRLRYDDGFVAYLNGVEVARENLRDEELAWDSRARQYPSREAIEYSDFDISEYQSLLREGENVLAVRTINSSARNSDILMQPLLVLRDKQFLRSPDSRIYYTLDGSDPRGSDGNPSASARLIDADDTITITENTRVTARNIDSLFRSAYSPKRLRQASIVETDWSAPVSYDFQVSQQPLVISELNYNPAEPTAEELEQLPGLENEDFEFIEVFNPSSTVVDLTGVKIENGVEFDFADHGQFTIEPNERLVVVRNLEAFKLRYESVTNVVGQYEGSLDNAGERVDVVDSLGEVLFRVSYNDRDPWPASADGWGATLELLDPRDTPSEVQSKSYAWRGSTDMHGSPGLAGTPHVGVVINEIRANSVDDQEDTLELYNASGQTIDISGWYLSDDSEDLQKYQVPDGTQLAADAYLVIEEGQFSAGANGFGLSGDNGDEVWLTIGEGGKTTGFVDDVRFGATLAGTSIGRISDGVGRFTPLANLSLGSVNVAAKIGDVIISELHYHPAAATPAVLTVDPLSEPGDLEYIELTNRSDQTIDLADWRIRGGVTMDFDADTELGQGESLLVLSFNPERPENAARLAGFRTAHRIGSAIRVVGGYGGRLGDAGDVVRLLRRAASPADRPNFVPYVLVDEVVYDMAPWPIDADGGGTSLQRLTPVSYGNDVTSWFSAQGSPGSPTNDLWGDFDGDSVVDGADIDLLATAIRNNRADSQFDLNADGVVNEDDRMVLVGEVMGLTPGDANVDGIFDSSDLVFAATFGEFEDDTAGNSTWGEGDWDGDGDFTTEDIVFAFTFGASFYRG